ncbi:hypothetical protein E2I00_010834, partial [Balaenoptera physalus]
MVATVTTFHRETWRQGLAGRAHLLSPRTMSSVKTPVDLAISGMQTLHVQQRCRGSCRVKVRPSYVDETLFGGPAGTQPTPPVFDPPWMRKASRTRGVGTGASQASGANGSCETTSSRDKTLTLAPRKKNKYRLIGHTPSYCDESLFGSRPEGAGWEAPWMAKGDAAKLHALFWTPPATPRDSHSPRPRETPVRAIHPAGPSNTERRVVADARRLSVDGLDSPRPPRRERSYSLTHLNVPSTGLIQSVFQCQLPPDEAGPPRNQSHLGNEFLGPFCRFAHGVTAKGRVSEDGT